MIIRLTESEIREIVKETLDKLHVPHNISRDDVLCRFPYPVTLLFSDHAIQRKYERQISRQDVVNDITCVVKQIIKDFEDGVVTPDNTFKIVNRDNGIMSVCGVRQDRRNPSRISNIEVVTVFIWDPLKNNLEGGDKVYYTGEDNEWWQAQVEMNREHADDIKDYLHWKYGNDEDHQRLKAFHKKADNEYYWRTHPRPASHDTYLKRLAASYGGEELKKKIQIHDALPAGDLDTIRKFHKDMDKRHIDLTPLEDNN